MSLNDGFSETFIFHIKYEVFRVVINFTKKMCTVYSSDNRIIMRRKNLSQLELQALRKKIVQYLKEEEERKKPKFFGGLLI